MKLVQNGIQSFQEAEYSSLVLDDKEFLIFLTIQSGSGPTNALGMVFYSGPHLELDPVTGPAGNEIEYLLSHSSLP